MNAGMHKARNGKNDEFYAQLSDVEAELVHYGGRFRGYCPEQFEIVGFREGDDGKDLAFTRDGKRVQPYFWVLVRRRMA